MLNKIRSFGWSASSRFPRTRPELGEPAPPQLKKTGILLDEDNTEDEADSDQGTSVGHLILQQQREVLHYLRLIEHDLPNLVSWRKLFKPPSIDAPLIIRTVSYAGEDHPVSVKRSVVLPVSRLGLTTDAIHNVKLLAGNRWSPLPPKNAGVALDAASEKHGFIQIACEDFPQPGMNLKWASDSLDNLVRKALDVGSAFSALKIDTRHIDTKIKIRAKYHQSRDGYIYQPTIRDFPKNWLPKNTLQHAITSDAATLENTKSAIPMTLTQHQQVFELADFT